MELRYLRPDVLAEPLWAQWYGWVQLLSPVTAALNVANRHVPTMVSFVSSPAMHAAAAKNPELLGGPFMAYGEDRVDEVRSLLEWTRREQRELLELAEAIKALHQLVREQATGMSMEPLYSSVPEELKGCVELEYDVYSRPSFRLLEPLLYQSRYYDERFQSVALSLAEGDERPFMLSSPRLDDPSSLRIDVPFGNEAWDGLFAMRSTAASAEEAAESLGVSPQEPLWLQLFTDDAPPPPERFIGEGLRIRYFGHASLLLETRDVSVLIDPVIGYSVGTPPERFTFTDLPSRIDYVLITHQHQDHIQLETLLQLRHKVDTVVVGKNSDGHLQDPSLRLALEHMGFSRVIELTELETLDVPGGRIAGVPFLGEHHDLSVRSRLGYRIDLQGRSVMALADICNHEPAIYERVADVLGPADVLFLGMECVGSPLTWSYGHLLPDKPSRQNDRSRRGRGSNADEAKSLVKLFGATTVYNYAMGEEPWLRHILGLAYSETSPQILQSNEFVEWCRESGLTAGRLYGKAELVLGPRLSDDGV